MPASWARGARVLSLVAGVASGHAAMAQDTTFLRGPELADRLKQNLVWISADGIGEHGFGLIVGGDATTLWIATARHVVVKTAMRGSGIADEPSSDVRVRLCGDESGARVAARTWSAWDPAGEDLALLSVVRPAGYQLVVRAMAADAKIGEPVWLVGSADECNVVPTSGRVRAAADEGHNLRVDFAGVQGGSSGGIVVGGNGIVGLMKSADDVTTTVHDIADLQRRVAATPAVRWELVDAKNSPPTSKNAARIDISETLDQYLGGVHNAQMLFREAKVARANLDDYVRKYNAALERFLRVRNAYDGTLDRFWPPPVLIAWRDLRDTLWSVHETFWAINPQMTEMYRSQRTTADVRAQMATLEPKLARLTADTRQFLQLLNQEN